MFFCLPASALAEAAAGATPNLPVRFADGKLSVDFQSVRAKDALQAIEKAAKVQIRAPGPIMEKRLTAKFEDVALEQGIRQIARSLEVANSAVLYEGETQIFVLLEKGQSLPYAATPPTTEKGSASVKAAAPAAAPKAKVSPEQRWATQEEREARKQQTRAQKIEDKIKALEERGNSRRAERLRERLSGVGTKPPRQQATPTQAQ
jgi:hypothetical protein